MLPPVPGLASIVTRLKQRGLALGIATSDSREGAMATLAPFGVLEQFDFIAGYDSGPQPEAGSGHGSGILRRRRVGAVRGHGRR